MKNEKTEKTIRGRRRPRHLTPDQWEVFIKTGELSERLTILNATIELFWTKRLGNFEYGEIPPLLRLKMKEYSQTLAEYKAITETDAYKEAAEADTCRLKENREPK